MIAVTHFRTHAAGAYKWLRMGKLTRGHWRVLVVRDPKKSMAVTSHNVVEVLWEGHEGLDGVTSRSRYWIGHERARAEEIARAWNQERLLAETCA